MLDWIKRAWRDLRQAGPFARMSPTADTSNQADLMSTAYLKGLNDARAAQKNLRLHSIARERSRIKDEIARLKRNKKRHSHLLSELVRLTRLELELEGGK